MHELRIQDDESLQQCTGMANHHHHVVANHNRAFAFGIGLNVIYILVEVIFGVFAGSLALLADAGHNLSDVLGLLLAWGAANLSSLKPGVTTNGTELYANLLRRFTDAS